MTAERESPPNNQVLDEESTHSLSDGAAHLAQLRATGDAHLQGLYHAYQALLAHADDLQRRLDDLSVIYDTSVEHNTQIENELSVANEELTRSHQIIRDDLVVASQVQMALMPRVLSDMEGELEVAIHHKQLTEVGGDYYDFFRLPNDRYAVGVFDISGHGVSSALIMAFLKAQFIQVMEHLDTPQGIVEWVNRSSYAFLREIRRYATVNFVAFDEDAIRYVSGGGYGVVVRDGEAQLFNKKNHFLGLRLKPYQEFVLPFESGDLLALYTDGMIEAPGHEGLDYGAHRLNQLLLEHRDLPVQQLLDLIVEDYTNFRKEDTDDITLLLMRRR